MIPLRLARVLLCFGVGWFAGNVIRGDDRPDWLPSRPTLIVLGVLAAATFAVESRPPKREYFYSKWDRWDDDES